MESLEVLVKMLFFTLATAGAIGGVIYALIAIGAWWLVPIILLGWMFVPAPGKKAPWK